MKKPKAFLLARNTALFMLLSLLLVRSAPPSGTKEWGSLLEAHVDEKGFVDYEGMRSDRERLHKALKKFGEKVPGSDASDKERIAYWINVYNAFAIELVLQHYPLESIRDIDNAFGREFIELGTKKYSLDGIEKGILLEEFDDPRIHYAVNCASISCPPLRDEPYRASELEAQLEEQARRFINDPDKNRLNKGQVRISKLYDWYKADFTRSGSLIQHLNRYAEGIRVKADASIAFMEYDWGLNESS